MRRTHLYLLFLLAYATVLGWHLYGHFEATSPWHAAALIAGIVLAGVAHWSRHGFLALIFLVGHMGLEWYHHGTHWIYYTLVNFALYGTHVLFDLTFLWRELSVHARKFRTGVALSVCGVLSGIFWISFVPKRETINFSPFPAMPHEHIASPFSILLMSGLLGCVLAHILLAHNHKKHP